LSVETVTWRARRSPSIQPISLGRARAVEEELRRAASIPEETHLLDRLVAQLVCAAHLLEESGEHRLDACAANTSPGPLRMTQRVLADLDRQLAPSLERVQLGEPVEHAPETVRTAHSAPALAGGDQVETLLELADRLGSERLAEMRGRHVQVEVADEVALAGHDGEPDRLAFSSRGQGGEVVAAEPGVRVARAQGLLELRQRPTVMRRGLAELPRRLADRGEVVERHRHLGLITSEESTLDHQCLTAEPRGPADLPLRRVKRGEVIETYRDLAMRRSEPPPEDGQGAAVEPRRFGESAAAFEHDTQDGPRMEGTSPVPAPPPPRRSNRRSHVVLLDAPAHPQSARQQAGRWSDMVVCHSVVQATQALAQCDGNQSRGDEIGERHIVLEPPLDRFAFRGHGPAEAMPHIAACWGTASPCDV
jgi:hypothetical protein